MSNKAREINKSSIAFFIAVIKSVTVFAINEVWIYIDCFNSPSLENPKTKP